MKPATKHNNAALINYTIIGAVCILIILGLIISLTTRPTPGLKGIAETKITLPGGGWVEYEPEPLPEPPLGVAVWEGVGYRGDDRVLRAYRTDRETGREPYIKTYQAPEAMGRMPLTVYVDPVTGIDPKEYAWQRLMRLENPLLTVTIHLPEKPTVRLTEVKPEEYEGLITALTSKS